LILLAVLPLGCSRTVADQRTGPTDQTTTAATRAKATMAMPDHESMEKQIVIDNFTFDPPEVAIPAGTRVTWLNRDDVPHTATSTAKPRAFDSGPLDTDQKYSFTFTSAGVYEYFCAVHPRMTGRITVK
jgi:plastocyanin